MLTYVAAFATAATLMIGPMLERHSEPKKEPVRWTASEKKFNPVSITTTISLSGSDKLYFLSVVEQRLLKKALLRSVTIVNSGERLA